MFVLPWFMADGYFTRVAVPGAVRPSAAAGGRPITLCAPLGAAEGLADVISDCALAACNDHGLTPRATAIVLAGHGSRDQPASRRAVEAHAARLAGRSRFAAVRVAFLEEPPSLADALGTLGGDVVVVGLFALSGNHADRDIPAAIVSERRRRLGKTVYTGAIGVEPAIASVVVDLVRQAEAR